MLSLLLALNLASLSAARADDPCACPSTDKVSKMFQSVECSKYRPAKLNRKCFSDRECALPQSQVEPGSANLQAILDKTSPIKSYRETLDYMSCHRVAKRDKHDRIIFTADEQFCHFKQTAAPYIELAGRSGGIRPTLLACLVDAESDFVPKAHSGVGAKGYSQFMDDTISDVAARLKMPLADQRRDYDRQKAKVDELAEQLKSVEADLEPYTAVVQPLRLVAREQQADIVRATRALNKKPKSVDLKKDLAQCKAALAATRKEIAEEQSKYPTKISQAENLESELDAARRVMRGYEARLRAREVWDDYWEGSSPIPKSFTKYSVTCPRIAFVAAAMKQVLDLYSIFTEDEIGRTDRGNYYIKTLKVDRKAGEDETAEERDRNLMPQRELDSALYMAGAYNWGIGRFPKRCLPEDGLKTCLSFYNKQLPRETVTHMNAIKNCAETGSTRPMRSDNVFKPDGNKDCEAMKCAN